MKTFAITSNTNYGETIMIINAVDEEQARTIAKHDQRVWDHFELEELDITTPGIAFFGGGDF